MTSRTRFIHRRRGVTGLSYGLIVGLVGIVALAAITNIGSGVNDLMSQVSDNLDGAASSSGDGAGGGEEQAAASGPNCSGISSGGTEIFVSAAGTGSACTAEAPCDLTAARSAADSSPGAIVTIMDDLPAGDSGSWVMQANETLCSSGGAKNVFGRVVTVNNGVTIQDLTISRGGSSFGLQSSGGNTNGLTISNVDIKNTDTGGIYFTTSTGTVTIEDVNFSHDDGGTSTFGMLIYNSGSSDTNLSISNYNATHFQHAAISARAQSSGQALRMTVSGSNSWTGSLTPGMYGDPDSMNAFGLLVDGVTGASLHADISGVNMDRGYTGFYTWHPDAHLYVDIHNNSFSGQEQDSVFAGILYNTSQQIDISIRNNQIETGLYEDIYSPGDFYDGFGVRIQTGSSANGTICTNITGNTITLRRPTATGLRIHNGSSSGATLQVPNSSTLAADNGGTTVTQTGGITTGGSCSTPSL